MNCDNLEPANPSLYPICEHIKSGGERCGSPALRDGKYCYYHGNMRKLVPKTNLFVHLWRPHPEDDPNFAYELPYPEDPDAIQIGFAQVINAVCQERMRPDHAKLILSALHGAALNLRLKDKFARRAEKMAKQQKPPASVHAEEKIAEGACDAASPAVSAMKVAGGPTRPRR